MTPGQIKQMILLEGEWVDTVLKNGNDYDTEQVQKANAYIRLFRKDRYEQIRSIDYLAIKRVS